MGKKIPNIIRTNIQAEPLFSTEVRGEDSCIEAVSVQLWATLILHLNFHNVLPIFILEIYRPLSSMRFSEDWKVLCTT